MPELIVIRFFSMQHSPALQRFVPVPAVTEETGEAKVARFSSPFPKLTTKHKHLKGTTTPQNKTTKPTIFVFNSQHLTLGEFFG